MGDLGNLKLKIALAAVFGLSILVQAQEPGCIEISHLAALARASSSATLKLRKQKVGDNYRARLMFAARMLELAPQNPAAADSLLDLLPKSELGPEQSAWLDLSELQSCPSGGPREGDLIALDRLQDPLPGLAAKAVILVPEKMPVYVAYSFLSLNPESDYAVRMQEVCNVRNKQFIAAVDQLSPKDKSWFVSKILNPKTCHAIWLPEQ